MKAIILFLVLGFSSPSLADKNANFESRWIQKEVNGSEMRLSVYSSSSNDLKTAGVITYTKFDRPPSLTNAKIVEIEIKNLKKDLPINGKIELTPIKQGDKSITCLSYQVIVTHDLSKPAATLFNQCMIFGKTKYVLNTLTIFSPGHESEMISDQMKFIESTPGVE